MHQKKPQYTNCMKGTKKDVGRTNGCQVYRKGTSKQRPQRWDSYMVCNKKMTVS